MPIPLVFKYPITSSLPFTASRDTSCYIAIMRSLILILLSFLAPFTQAQFQFFEQMFQGGGQQHQQQHAQNVPSDSKWYQETYEQGKKSFPKLPPTSLDTHS